MRLVKILLASLCLFTLSNMPAHSVPAYPKPVKFVQPDGTVVTYRIIGDEHNHWLESTGGYVLKRADNGYLCYAGKDSNGAIVAAGKYMGNDSQASANMKLLRRDDMIKSDGMKLSPAGPNKALQINGTFPLKGKRKLLMLLVNFADTQPSFDADKFRELMNAPDYNGTGSFRDYYLETSYNQLDIETTVVGWLQLPRQKSLYSTEDMSDLIRDALALVDPSIDIHQFDNDGDGELDGLSIIHQGMGQEVSGSTSDIWSHSSELLDQMYGDVRVKKYTIQPEILFNDPYNGLQMTTVGVLCHEFGHNLGAPDYYDTDYEDNGYYNGTGIWDLMADGIWSEHYLPGDSPSSLNMWQKIQFGWVEPKVLDSTATVTDMPAATDEPVGYIVKTKREGDYFVLENRQVQKFDRELPGHGLIVYHVDENRINLTAEMNTVNCDYQQGLYTVCASATSDPGDSPESYGNINSAGAPFPGSTRKTTWTDTTTPSTHSNDGKYSYFSLSDISENDGKVSFKFTSEEVPAAVNNFAANAKRGVVTLTWEAPDADGIKDYRIYRDNVQIATTNDLTYVDENPGKIIVTYKVDVEYDNGLVSPFAEATVRLPENRIESLSTKENADGIELTWEMNTDLSRSDLNYSDVVYQYVYSNETDFAQRFNEKDLRAYNGYSITGIGFFPFSSQRTTSYKIRVWRAAAGTDDMQIVNERDITEYGSGNWCIKQFDTPTVIEPGYDYMIGVYGNTSDGGFRIICDGTTYTPGLGNLVLSEGEWRDDIIQLNPLMKATLEPSSAKDVFVPGETPVFDDDYNPQTDAEYPIGFNVYRNDEFIGFTSSRTFVDSSVSKGVNRYGVVCLYEGNNESAPVERSIYVTTGINDITASGVSIEPCDGGITVTTDGNAHVSVYSVSGSLLAGCNTGGSVTVSLAPGVYIVKCGDVVRKVMVR